MTRATKTKAWFGMMCVVAVMVSMLPGCSGGGCSDSAYQEWKERAETGPGKPSDDLAKLRADAEAAGGVAPVEPTQRDKAREKLDSAANAIGWIAGLCAIASLGTLILSFMVPVIPTKTSAGCFAASLLGYGLQYALLVYGVLFAEIAIWLGVLVCGGIGASVLIPWAIAAVGYLQARTGQRLIAEAKTGKADPADIRAGVALIAAAEALKPDERKELLASVARS